MGKYKYYFRKPKSVIVVDILKWLAVAGAGSIAPTSPHFGLNILKMFSGGRKYDRRKVCNTFYRLKKRGCINIQQKNHQIYISLTEEGRKKAGRFQIDSLEIKKPKKWDGMWRLVIFDIPQLKSVQRNAFRGKLIELGFMPLQKSIWICPHQCKDEIGLLRDFFGLSEKEIRLITAKDIENDSYLRKVFKLIYPL